MEPHWTRSHHRPREYALLPRLKMEGEEIIVLKTPSGHIGPQIVAKLRVAQRPIQSLLHLNGRVVFDILFAV